MKNSSNVGGISLFAYAAILTPLTLLLIFQGEYIVTASRHVELYIVLTHLPEKFLQIVGTLFEKWPPGPGGVFYRPLQVYILPYLYFHLFGWNHSGWLASNLLLSGLTVLLTAALVGQLSRNKLAALLSGLFLAGFFAPAYAYYEVMQYDAECLYLVFMLISLLAFSIYDQTENRTSFRISLIAFVLGLFSKEPAFLTPLLITLMISLFPRSMPSAKGMAPSGDVPQHSGWRQNLWRRRGDLLPFFILMCIYFCLRFLLPILQHGNVGDANKINGLSISVSLITQNLLNLLLGLIQFPAYVFFAKGFPAGIHTVLGPLSLSWGIFLRLLALSSFLPAASAIRRLQPLPVFGLLFTSICLGPMLLLNAPASPHHLVPGFIGMSICVGSALPGWFDSIENKGSRTRKFGFIFLVAAGLFASGIQGTKEYLQFYDYQVQEGRLWQNRFFAAVEQTLPPPNQRHPNTIFFIRNYNEIGTKGDFYWMTIKPAYYGTSKGLQVFHDGRLDSYKPLLASLDPASCTLIVLEHVDWDTPPRRITDEAVIAKYQSLIGAKQ